MLSTVNRHFKLNSVQKEEEELATHVRRLLEKKLEELHSVISSTNTMLQTKSEDPLHIPSRATPIVNELH